MADKQGWRDFSVIISRIEMCTNEMQALYNGISRLEKDKAEIVDDTARLAEVKKILDIHPDYSVTWARQRIAKLSELKTWLDDNGYL